MNDLLGKLRARWLAWYRASPLEEFFLWWKAELRALVPRSWLDWLDQRSEYLLVVLEDRAWVFYRAGGEQPAELGRVDTDLEEPDGTRDRVARLLAEFEESRPKQVVCLPSDQALLKDLTLPAAASENLAQVLAYEMDRHTPFRADQVYFDYRIVSRDTESRTLGIRLAVSPRGGVDELLEALAARGVTPDRLDVAAAGGVSSERIGVNLLPPESRAHRSSNQLKLNVGLGAAAVVLLVLAMWQAMSLREARIETLKARMEKARSQAMEVAALRKELEDAVQAANFLMNKKHQRPVLINVLQEVTRLLPDDVWLTRLQLQGKRLTVLGQAPSAADVLGTINDSPLLADAGFVSAVTSSPNGMERFQIEATVQPETSPFETGGDEPAAADRGKPARTTARQSPDKTAPKQPKQPSPPAERTAATAAKPRKARARSDVRVSDEVKQSLDKLPAHGFVNGQAAGGSGNLPPGTAPAWKVMNSGGSGNSGPLAPRS